MPGSSVPLTHLSQFYEAHPEAKVLIQNARAPQRRNGIDAFVANAHAADRLVLEGSQAIAALRVVDGAPYKLITTLEALDAYVADVENSEVAVMALGTAGHGEDGVAMLQVACDNSSRPVLIDLLVLERTHTRSELGSRIRALLVVPPLKLIHDCHDASSRLACQFSLGGVPVYVKSLLDTQLVHEHAHPDTPWCSFAAMLCTYAPDAAHVTRAADSKKQLKDGDVSPPPRCSTQPTSYACCSTRGARSVRPSPRTSRFCCSGRASAVGRGRRATDPVVRVVRSPLTTRTGSAAASSSRAPMPTRTGSTAWW